MIWQTIDSAPKDGRLIWLLADGCMHIGYFDAGWRGMDDVDGRWILKTCFTAGNGIASCHHDVTPGFADSLLWQPLPEPPQ